MSAQITIWTYDWVPEGPRGFVRDIRLRWAAEEAGLAYQIKTVPLGQRKAEHFARQPFGQVPYLDDGDIRIFESGACLLHLAEQSELLMPRDPVGRAETVQWLISALNSMEMVTVPWWFINLGAPEENPLSGWVNSRFERLDKVLQDNEWLAASRFTAADILMCDVLRMPKKLGQLDAFEASRNYVDRITARPAFKKAYADQMAHFEAGDALRAAQ